MHFRGRVSSRSSCDHVRGRREAVGGVRFPAISRFGSVRKWFASGESIGYPFLSVFVHSHTTTSHSFIFEFWEPKPSWTISQKCCFPELGIPPFCVISHLLVKGGIQHEWPLFRRCTNSTPRVGEVECMGKSRITLDEFGGERGHVSVSHVLTTAHVSFSSRRNR